MKIIKTYALDKPLDKDIDQFIRDARKGAYKYDYKYGMGGLKLIKQYFKFINAECDKENYALARTTYKKLIFFLFETSSDYDYFNYEDIIDRSKLNFDKIMTNYFTCLIKLCTVKGLFDEYFEYIKAKKEYYFEAVEKTIIEQLNKEKFEQFEELVYKKANTLKKKDYYENDLIYFLLDLAKKRNGRKKYCELCDEFKDIIDEAEEQKKYFDKDD